MSEGDENPNANAGGGGDSGEALKKLEEEVQSLKSVNSRLLEESKDNKAKYRTSQDEIDTLKNKNLEKEGNHKELLQSEREKTRRLEGDLLDTRKSVVKEKLRTEAIKFGKDAHNIDMVLKVVEHQDLIRIDENTLSVSGVEDFVKKVRDTSPYLFAKGSLPTTENTKPLPGDPGKPASEKEQYFAELKKCKTQKELDAVMLKHGRSING